MSLLLTQSSGVIIGPISQLFGIIMNGIFIVLENIVKIFNPSDNVVVNIGVCLIIFTIIVNILMIPLTYKQQKFSFVSAKMNPEIKAVQKKYQGKKDTASMQKMNDETQAVYEKYGISPTGSCLPLLIQLPIIWGLYQVVLNVPAYVESVRNVFNPLISAIQGVAGYEGLMEGFVSAAGIQRLVNPVYSSANTLIDVFYKTSTNGWAILKDNFPTCVDQINTVSGQLDHMNSFLGLNLSNSPIEIIKGANGQIGIIILAILIPVLAFLSSYLTTKLTPQQTDDNSTMSNSLKTMNLVMPIFSAVLSLSFATGIGIYWVFNSVCGCVIRLVINKKFNKMDFEEYLAKNAEKAEKKREKRGVTSQQLTENARISTKNIKMQSSNEIDEANYNKDAVPGSLREKANLVKKYNEQNNK